jgi:Co/Zn/Cd efflux system component
MHARVAESTDRESVLKALQTYLAERHGIGHSTIQIEFACADEGAQHHP